MKPKDISKIRWVYGIRVITNVDPVWKYILPKEVTNNKSPHFEKSYYWLFWYFNKIRTCDRCGKLACTRGHIRLMDDKQTKILAYLCQDCAKSVSVLKNRARKHCKTCHFETCFVANRKWGKKK